MTRWLWPNFLCVLVSLVPSQAVAIECDPEDPSRCAVPLAAGQEAPFDGQLLTTQLALDLGLKANQCDAHIKLQVDFAEKTAALDLGLERALRENNQKRYRQELEAVVADRDRWKQLAAVPFYEEPWLVATVTAVVVSVIFVGASQALR